MKEESDFSTCRRCGTIKVRKFVGMFDEKNKRYFDEKDRLWNGRICPSCVAHQAMLRMRKKRKEAKDAKSQDNPSD